MRLGIYLERKPTSGGAYQYCLAMLKALHSLPETEYEITAFCTYDEWRVVTKRYRIRTELVTKNLIQKVFHYAAEKLLSVKFYRKFIGKHHPLARKLAERQIDACIYPCGDKISFMLETPAIVSVFDLMHRYLTGFDEISNYCTFRNRERSYTNIARYAEIVLVDSRVGRDQMIECYELDGNLGNKIKILPFIAPDYVYESTGEEKVPEGLKFERFIFYPAQFWKHKNHKNLLLALAQMKKKGIIVNAVFCGSGKNAYEEVQTLIHESGLEDQVQIMGYVTNEEMVALYRKARALVMPTFGGPTNIPQLEAFVLGCPVATSNIFGIPEQVGEAALLFRPEKVEEIADCIQRLWTDDKLCSELSRKGHERARQWGEEQFFGRVLEIMQEYFPKQKG